MPFTTGTVVDGKIVLDSPLADGARVAVLNLDTDAASMPTAAEIAAWLAAVTETERQEQISLDEVLGTLSPYY